MDNKQKKVALLEDRRLWLSNFSKSSSFYEAIEHEKVKINDILEELLLLKPERLNKSTICIDCTRAKELIRQKKHNLFIDTIIYEQLCLDTHQQALNWSTETARLYPISTSGDGNCLCHAIMISLIGMHDHGQVLRTALHTYMSSDRGIENALRQRFNRHRKLLGARVGAAFMNYELLIEWQEAKKRSSTNKENPNNIYFLEDIHVFVLSNLLKRPIIVVSADLIDEYQPSFIRGIYLPTLNEPSECVKKPILICFHQSHFTSLLYATDTSNKDTLYEHVPAKTLFPLCNKNLEDMPILFLLEDEERNQNLLSNYLNLKVVRIKKKNVPCVDISAEFEINILSEYFDHVSSAKKRNKNCSSSNNNHLTNQQGVSKLIRCAYPQCTNPVKSQEASFCMDHYKSQKCAKCGTFNETSLCSKCNQFALKVCGNPGCGLVLSRFEKDECDKCKFENIKMTYSSRKCPKPMCTNMIRSNEHKYCDKCTDAEIREKFILTSNLIDDTLESTAHPSKREAPLSNSDVRIIKKSSQQASTHSPTEQRRDLLSQLKESKSAKQQLQKCKNPMCARTQVDGYDGHCERCAQSQCKSPSCNGYFNRLDTYAKYGYCLDCYEEKCARKCAATGCNTNILEGRQFCQVHSPRHQPAKPNIPINMDTFRVDPHAARPMPSKPITPINMETQGVMPDISKSNTPINVNTSTIESHSSRQQPTKPNTPIIMDTFRIDPNTSRSLPSKPITPINMETQGLMPNNSKSVSTKSNTPINVNTSKFESHSSRQIPLNSSMSIDMDTLGVEPNRCGKCASATYATLKNNLCARCFSSQDEILSLNFSFAFNT